ncbi:MAG: xanthine dehydrogenase family protein molybdopterin-binding subunit [Bdellovibrionales bacterium]|nr:xanthine dehydrogenase family protein molybdopterin-binding subunit [Bdellovibrionales bacterium]
MFISNRREFLKTSLTTSGSFIVALTLPLPHRGWKAFAKGESGFGHHYFEITPDNQFVFIMDKAEMGQGVYTGQLTLFGEEIKINPNLFQVKSAPVAEVYSTFNGHMITGGSTSTADRWMILREAGANLRELFKMAAAQKWSVNVDQVECKDGQVFAQSGTQKLTFGELIEDASKIKNPPKGKLTDPKDFIYIGKPQVGLDAMEKSKGSDRFGIDVQIDNMASAVVERGPSFGAHVKSFNASEVKALDGVIDVFKVSSGVAIVCEKYWQAMRARKSLIVEWGPGSLQDLDSEGIFTSYKNAMEKTKAHEVEREGEPESAFAGADQVIEAEYRLPYLAHSPMEPMNATAWVQKDRCDIWCPTQGPSLVRNKAAMMLGLPREKVFVHNSVFLGGGFGRRSTLDYVVDALEISKKIKRPVKVLWSREDDTKHSPLRPITFHKMKASIKNGRVTGWQHDLGCESIMQYVIPQWFGLMAPDWVPDFLLGSLGKMVSFFMSLSGKAPTVAEGATHIPYTVENRLVKHYQLGIKVPIHFWRSVGHSYNAFVVESFIDEIAHKLGQDPMEYRLKNMTHNDRLRATLEIAKEKSNWGKPSQGRFQGVASHSSFKSFASEVVEVEVHAGQIQVKKVTAVIDCGTPVNPDIIKKQMESGIIYGLSAALQGEIKLSAGGVDQSNFDDYPPLRMSQTPEIEVHIVASTEKPTGVGEPGLPPIAPAVANAVFAATGQRLYDLPLRLT